MALQRPHAECLTTSIVGGPVISKHDYLFFKTGATSLIVKDAISTHAHLSFSFLFRTDLVNHDQLVITKPTAVRQAERNSSACVGASKDLSFASI
jgi:hypothetical protein